MFQTRLQDANVYIGGTNQDIELKIQLSRIFQSLNLQPFSHRVGEDITPEWRDKTKRAIRKSKFFSIVLSRSSLNSEQVQHELTYAHALGKKVFAVLNDVTTTILRVLPNFKHIETLNAVSINSESVSQVIMPLMLGYSSRRSVTSTYYKKAHFTHAYPSQALPNDNIPLYFYLHEGCA